MKDYSVVIFKNKIKRKILKNYKSLDLANDFFSKFLDKSKNILFEKQYENGSKCFFELLIIGPPNPESYFFIKDGLGRNVKIYSEGDEFSIYKLNELKIEEELYDIFNKRKITYSEFINTYTKKPNLKMFSKLNNKLVYQNDNDLEIFSLKNLEDCERLFSCLSNHIQKNGLIDCLIIEDFDQLQKKYLYKLLEEKGISKKSLYRQSTTHLK